ncbi:MAG: hypothetical protein ISR44_07000 [Rhodospirillales bacterium]|nr:hypothetical protein [Rhodospirillales bacterium]
MQPISSSNRTIPSGLMAGIAFGICLFLVFFFATSSWASTPSWQPSASERLVKLPSNYLKKAIDRDFAESDLASALTDVNSRVQLKGQTLGDLQAAIDKAEGDVKIELRHQFLAEKQEFIKLMGEQQDMRRKQVETKIKLYERLLAKLERRGAGMTPTKAKLLDNQKAARERFEGTASGVDMAIFGSAAVSESRYSREYAKNMTAIEALVAAIKEHPMTAEPEINGQPVSKQDYLRQLIAENQARVAIVEQEENILGYMAKIVALDAMALSEEVAAEDIEDSGVTGEDGEVSLSAAVDFFVP